MKTRILLAGSTGAIGRRLGPLLSGAGHEVIGLSRSGASAGAGHLRVDVLDRDAVTAAVRAVRPEAAADRAANARLRREGTRHLVDAALAYGVRRIIAQSISWAYEPGAGPATEATPLDLGAAEPRRTSVAGVAALEEAVREVPEWVVLRYGTLYGPGTWYAPGGAMARRVPPAGPDVASFLHVDDAAAAAVAALSWPSGAVNVCDDEPAPASDWVPAFCEAVGVPAPAPTGGTRQGWARGADNGLARRQRGWTPGHPSWQEGFAAL